VRVGRRLGLPGSASEEGRENAETWIRDLARKSGKSSGNRWSVEKIEHRAEESSSKPNEAWNLRSYFYPSSIVPEFRCATTRGQTVSPHQPITSRSPNLQSQTGNS